MIKQILATLTGLVLLIVAINSGATSLSQDHPEIVLTSEGLSVDGVSGSYCWEGTCVDKIPGYHALSDEKATAVEKDSAVKFSIINGPEPEYYRYNILSSPNLNSSVQDGTTNGSIDLSRLENGVYYVSSIARWNGSDISYWFKIKATE